MHQAGRATRCPRVHERCRIRLCTYSSSRFLFPVHRNTLYPSRRKSELTRPDPIMKCRLPPPYRAQPHPNHQNVNCNRHRSVSTIALRAGMSSALRALRAPNSHVPKWMHHVGRIGLDHSTVTHGGAQLLRGKPTREFTGVQGSGVVDRTPMSGVALGDVIVKLKWTCRTETGHATGGRILHASVGL